MNDKETRDALITALADVYVRLEEIRKMFDVSLNSIVHAIDKLKEDNHE